MSMDLLKIQRAKEMLRYTTRNQKRFWLSKYDFQIKIRHLTVVDITVPKRFIVRK